jgi:nicotinate-nucleotide pyrophosphorylase (carboxylating)
MNGTGYLLQTAKLLDLRREEGGSVFEEKGMDSSNDIRVQIFRGHMARRITGCIVVEAAGVLSGIQRARHQMELLGLSLVSDLTDGTPLDEGQEFARVVGNPLQIAQAEERIIGVLSKSSGIATAARQARLLAGKRCRVVSGGWKKMPLEIKNQVRQALLDGGIDTRMYEDNFVYLDKNYVRIFGGVAKAIRAVASLGRAVVIQVRGEFEPIRDEAVKAAQMGASVVMVDTGRLDHLTQVIQALKDTGLRSRVRIAFAGNISLSNLENLTQMDLDVVDIGYAILDARCLRMHFDVVKVE